MLLNYWGKKQIKLFFLDFCKEVPFHMRIAIPLATSNKITLPKSSVTAASVLQGDRQMLSPWRLESGSPNLIFKRKQKAQITFQPRNIYHNNEMCKGHRLNLLLFT